MLVHVVVSTVYSIGILFVVNILCFLVPTLNTLWDERDIQCGNNSDNLFNVNVSQYEWPIGPEASTASRMMTDGKSGCSHGPRG